MTIVKSAFPDVDKMFSGPLFYVWAVIRNLVVVFMVFLLLSVAATKFEVVVLSILLLTLLHQASFHEVFVYGAYDQNLYILKLIRYVLIGLKSDDTYSSELQDQISRAEKILYTQQTKQVINSIFYYFLWLVIIWKIVSVL